MTTRIRKVINKKLKTENYFLSVIDYKFKNDKWKIYIKEDLLYQTRKEDVYETIVKNITLTGDISIEDLDKYH